MKKQAAGVGYLLWLIPIVLLGLVWFGNPFAHSMVTQHFSMAGLSPAQRVNLQVAARALDGVVLQAEEEFSFNRQVGPRTRGRGYLEAPSYLNGESPSTLGGGICLLSSAVYQVALLGGLEITERVPHLRTIRSVPPGLDATVWYGKADLRFRNTTGRSVRLETRMTDHNLIVTLKSASPQAPYALRRLVTRTVPGHVQVEVFRRLGGSETLISRDLYRVSP